MLRNTLEISFSKLQHNIYIIRERVFPCNIMVVLKSNAYGLGAVSFAEKLYDLGITNFGIASLQEALELRFLKKTHIHLLGSFLDEELSKLIDNDIILPINSFRQAELISILASKKNKIVQTQLLIDTGMGRFGIPLEQVEQEIEKIINLPNLNIIGIYSHFPDAYGDEDFTLQQISDFKKILISFPHINFKNIHIANSDAINNSSEGFSYQSPFNMVRVGIDLHGACNTMGLQEIFCLKSRLIEIKDLPKGASIGYGREHFLTKDTTIGVVAIGYADGVPLALSYEESYFKVRGQKVAIIGRVSMDYTTVDLSEVPTAKKGDEVICLDEELTVHIWAKIKKTIIYDIICAFGNRIKRVYKD